MLNRERLPGRSFTVTAPPAPPAPPPTPEGRSWWPAVGLAGLILAGVVAWWLEPRQRAAWVRYRASDVGRERIAFAAFRRACAAGDARAANRVLLTWLDRFPTDAAVATVESFAARAGDPELTARLAALQAAAFGANPTPWSPLDLARRVSAARSRLARRPRRRTDVLPPLNPSG